jgi:hypothetical protein
MAEEVLNRIYDVDQSKAVMLLCKPIKHILYVSCLGDKEMIEKILKCPYDKHIQLSKLN